MPNLRPIRAQTTVGMDTQGRPVAFAQEFLRWLELFQRCHEAVEAMTETLASASRVGVVEDDVEALQASVLVVETDISAILLRMLALETGLTVAVGRLDAIEGRLDALEAPI